MTNSTVVVKHSGFPVTTREVKEYSDKYDPEIMADIFDVFNDFSYVKPIPVLEAVAAFRKFHHERMAHFRTRDKSLYVGEDAYERRKADREKWDKLRQEAEILLFRSVVA